MRQSIKRELLRVQSRVTLRTDALVFEKGHTSGFQNKQANSSTKNVTVTKRCGAKSNTNDLIHDKIE